MTFDICAKHLFISNRFYDFICSQKINNELFDKKLIPRIKLNEKTTEH